MKLPNPVIREVTLLDSGMKVRTLGEPKDWNLQKPFYISLDRDLDVVKLLPLTSEAKMRGQYGPSPALMLEQRV